METFGLLGPLYEGIGNPEAMSFAMEKVVRHLKSRGSQFGVMDHSGHWFQANIVGVDPVALKSYVDHYAADDPRLPFFWEHLGQFIPCHQAVKDNGVFDRSALVNDLLNPNKCRFSISAIVPVGEDRYIALNLMRGLEDGQYGEAEVKQAQLLLPHLQQAMSLHVKLGGLESALSSLQAMVDRLDSPVILVDSNGFFCFANQAGLDAISLGSFLVLKNGKVEPRSQRHKQAFADLLNGSMTNIDNSVYYYNSSLRLQDKDGLGAVLTLQHLHGKPNLVGMPTASVALFLTYSAGRDTPAVGRLRSMFHFTLSEARVAESLMHGSTLEEIGETLNVTRDTLKSHLRWMFQKTGTHRQSQLVAALYSATTVRIT